MTTNEDFLETKVADVEEPKDLPKGAVLIFTITSWQRGQTPNGKTNVQFKVKATEVVENGDDDDLSNDTLPDYNPTQLVIWTSTKGGQAQLKRFITETLGIELSEDSTFLDAFEETHGAQFEGEVDVEWGGKNKDRKFVRVGRYRPIDN
jgi:hypothetical protein